MTSLEYDVAVGWACYKLCPQCNETPCTGRFKCETILDYVRIHHPEIVSNEKHGFEGE